jgi:uncharacterized protein (DUF488 family)
MPGPGIWTVGHGARPIEGLAAVLHDAGVERLVDVRRYPGSRRHPQFSRANLEHSLTESGIAYEWWGEELGGRRTPAEPTRHPEWKDAAFRGFADHLDTPVAQTALERLVTSAAARATAVMCAETDWQRCHRRLIADALAARGLDVSHLIDVGQRQAHPRSL